MIEVLVPYYGDPALLREAVRSVRAQTDGRWRLIVVDDQTADVDLSDWIRGLGDERITYSRNEDRLGVSGNFNRCLDLSTASHVVLLGCDDVLGPTYVERMYEALSRHPEAAAVHPDVAVIDAAGRSGRWTGDRVKRLLRPRVGGDRDRLLIGEALAGRLLTGVWTYFPAICWDGAFVRRHRFRADLETVLDMALLLELALEGSQLVLTNDQTFRYRRHAGSASSLAAMTSERFDEERALLGEMADRLNDVGWTKASRAARRHLSSRLHALMLVPVALREGAGRSALLALARHALGSIRSTRGSVESTCGASTSEKWYAERLQTRGASRWKVLLDVQAPYRWMVRHQARGRTLDIGCGVGRNLASLGPEAAGVDHNAHAVAVARTRGLRAMTTEEWRAREDDEREAYDTLLLAHVIEHMTAGEAEALLRAYLPALRPGGRIVLVCPQQRGFQSDPTHVQYHSGPQMASLLSRVGSLQPRPPRSFPLPAIAGRFFTYNESWVVAEWRPQAADGPGTASQELAATQASSLAAAAPASTAAAARSMPARTRSSSGPSDGS